MTDDRIQQQIALRDEVLHAVQPIHTEEDRLCTNSDRLAVKGWLKQFEALESDICDPVYKAWKNAKDRFKQGKQPALDFDAALERELRADKLRQDEERAKEQRRLDAAAQKRFDRAVAAGKPTPLPVPTPAIVPDVAKTVATENGKLTWVDNWVPEVYDENVLPREYLMPDMTKLAAAAKAGIEVPGMRRVNKPFQRMSR
jgi:hypothetical protein